MRSITHEERVWIARAALAGIVIRQTGPKNYVSYHNHGASTTPGSSHGMFTAARSAVRGLSDIGELSISERAAILAGPLAPDATAEDHEWPLEFAS